MTRFGGEGLGVRVRKGGDDENTEKSFSVFCCKCSDVDLVHVCEIGIEKVVQRIGKVTV